jgi:hypothetical protein
MAEVSKKTIKQKGKPNITEKEVTVGSKVARKRGPARRAGRPARRAAVAKAVSKRRK